MDWLLTRGPFEVQVSVPPRCKLSKVKMDILDQACHQWPEIHVIFLHRRIAQFILGDFFYSRPTMVVNGIALKIRVQLLEEITTLFHEDFQMDDLKYTYPNQILAERKMNRFFEEQHFHNQKSNTDALMIAMCIRKFRIIGSVEEVLEIWKKMYPQNSKLINEKLLNLTFQLTK